jgi:hypothetical protein
MSNGGSSSFVQNHPERSDEVIVYAAPEGDEIATYTRGTARLVNGEARVRLGDTFQWVTNPDIGLTAHVTPTGAWSDLYVASKSTRELVVRARDPEAADVEFDYLVYGLRVGFEELPIVQEKTEEAYLPIVEEVEVYEHRPDLRSYSALERFKSMRRATGETDEVDLSGAIALKNAIGVYDPEIHLVDRPKSSEGPEDLPEPAVMDEAEAIADRGHRRPARPSAARHPLLTTPTSQAETGQGTDLLDRVLYPVSEPIEVGEVLALDLERPGHLRRAFLAADPAVFGIAAAGASEIDGTPQVELVESRYAEVKADAAYGAILSGDLLVASPTPGHVMRAIDPRTGTVVGKAAEALETGSGLVKVLVMLR